MYKTRLISLNLLILIFISLALFSQEDVKIVTNGYNIFYGEDSIKVSEGTMRNGRPDGYWKRAIHEVSAATSLSTRWHMGTRQTQPPFRPDG